MRRKPDKNRQNRISARGASQQVGESAKKAQTPMLNSGQLKKQAAQNRIQNRSILLTAPQLTGLSLTA
jgi:hypothetical protein